MNGELSNRGKALALTGAVLQLGPVVGAAGTAIGMRREFNTLGKHVAGIDDPAQVSAAIGEVFVVGFAGFMLGLLGLVMLCLALLGAQYRARWFFWFLVIYGSVLLPLFPIGTAVGVFFIGTCLERRREFHFSRARECGPG